MTVAATAIQGVKIVTPRRFQDERGFFAEYYSVERFAQYGIAGPFVQDNHVYSRAAGTLRGLHFQKPPFAQAKLVGVLRGRVFDVAVDVRQGSSTYGQHVAVILSAEEGNQIYVPAGFAHGYCTLEPDTEVFYKVSAPYAPAHEGGLKWDDPALGIAWPVRPDAVILAAKDRTFPALADLPADFSV